MDKLTRCKLLLLTEYFAYMRRLQKGYPNDKCQPMLDDMSKLDNLAGLTPWEKNLVLDSILSRLIMLRPFGIIIKTPSPVDPVDPIDPTPETVWNDSSVWDDGGVWNDGTVTPGNDSWSDLSVWNDGTSWVDGSSDPETTVWTDLISWSDSVSWNDASGGVSNWSDTASWVDIGQW